MPSTTDYHSVSNAETESTPGLEHHTTTQQPQIDDDSDNNSDSEWERNPNVKGSKAGTSDPEDGEHVKDFRLGPNFIDQETWGIKLLAWTWEILLTLLPLFFICMAV